MNLIKRTSGSAARATRYRGQPLARPAALPAERFDEEIGPSHAEQLARLQDQLAIQERDCAEAQAEACDAAFERGRSQGREDAQTREQERLAVLGEAIETALNAFDARLRSERDLAIDIARVALERVLGDATRYRELVADTARHHAAALLRGTLVGVQVSVADFPDEAALAGLPQFGQSVAVVADPALEPGSCLFDLSLGSLDASIPRQAEALEAVLERARQSEADPR